MPYIQEQIEVVTLQYRIKGRSLLLHLKKKGQIKYSARREPYVVPKHQL